MSTATDSGLFDLQTLTPLHYVGILLAAITGVIHLLLGVRFAPSSLGLSFLFAGVVFLVASAAILANYRRRLLYGLGVPFTAGQIVIWYGVNFAAGARSFPADVGTFGWVDKAAQVLLIVVLIALLRQD
ncbi:hypothetical protein GCM10008995_19790 [Halobellus salinus]|uniref:Uncharacterized protein n=1 Tax=Halobellus salinus TaxID=931585 RepID=A0A830EH98_9EURY|nr:hypothetical protein [Halobellus salinus]GGJ09912.1 hypothetical protein GCM10008995_19790 [Halobellus salinus]SMP24822.1 hypothetical protein SAMN06265347_11060 [Halobellus salinus]